MLEGFFDVDNVLHKLEKKGDLLVSLDQAVNWEDFRPLLLRVREKSASLAGRKPYDEVLMFKVLILQSLYNLSDESTEVQILDRLSFRRFLNLTLNDPVPDATTIWLFREALTKKKLIRDLFFRFDLQLAGKGIEARKGSIIDASVVRVPRQKFSKEEKEELDEKGDVAEWSEEKRRQKDVDAKWGKKNDHSFFGYKNHICVDVENKVIRKYEVTDASVHDSQVAEKVVDHTNTSGKVYADSAYRSRKFLIFLWCYGLSERINRKARRDHPLTTNEKRGNKTKSKVRARVEHVFGAQLRRAGDLILRSIGFARAEAKIGLRNIAYNIERLIILNKLRASSV